jgi:hypothetical protein
MLSRLICWDYLVCPPSPPPLEWKPHFLFPPLHKCRLLIIKPYSILKENWKTHILYNHLCHCSLATIIVNPTLGWLKINKGIRSWNKNQKPPSFWGISQFVLYFNCHPSLVVHCIFVYKSSIIHWIKILVFHFFKVRHTKT